MMKFSPLTATYMITHGHNHNITDHGMNSSYFPYRPFDIGNLADRKPTGKRDLELTGKTYQGCLGYFPNTS